MLWSNCTTLSTWLLFSFNFKSLDLKRWKRFHWNIFMLFNVVRVSYKTSAIVATKTFEIIGAWMMNPNLESPENCMIQCCWQKSNLIQNYQFNRTRNIWKKKLESPEEKVFVAPHKFTEENEMVWINMYTLLKIFFADLF